MVGKVALLFIGLASVTNGQTVAGTTFVPRRQPRVDVLQKHRLSVRGGAGPLDADLVAKTNAILQMAQAAPLTLSPSKALELYGLSSSPMKLLLTERVFVSLLSYAINIWCIMFGGTSVNTAVGASTIPYAAFALKALLDGTPNKLDKHVAGEYVMLAVSAFVAYASFSGASYADTVTMCYAVWGIINGVFLALLPKKTGEVWGTKIADDGEIYLAKGMGFFILGAAIYMYALAQGVDQNKAMGYSMITHFVYLFDSLFVSKDVDTLGMSKEPFYAWLLEHIVTIGTLAL